MRNLGRVGNLSGVAKPTPALLARLGRGHAPRDARNIFDMVEGLEATDTLAVLLTKGIEKVTTTDGRLDTRDLAAFILTELKRHPK